MSSLITHNTLNFYFIFLSDNTIKKNWFFTISKTAEEEEYPFWYAISFRENTLSLKRMMVINETFQKHELETDSEHTKKNKEYVFGT